MECSCGGSTRKKREAGQRYDECTACGRIHRRESEDIQNKGAKRFHEQTTEEPKPKYRIGNQSIKQALRTCRQCARLVSGCCVVYSVRKLPFPGRPCRCRHFVAGEGVCHACGGASEGKYCGNACKQADYRKRTNDCC